MVIQRKLPQTNLEIAKTLNNLARSPQHQRLHHRSDRRLARGSGHPKSESSGQARVADTLTSLAAVLTQKAFKEAESNVCEALSIQTNVFGNTHPAVANSLNVLAIIKDKENNTAGEALYRQTLAVRQKLYGDEHLQVALSSYNLGRWLKGRFVMPKRCRSSNRHMAIQKKTSRPQRRNRQHRQRTGGEPAKNLQIRRSRGGASGESRDKYQPWLSVWRPPKPITGWDLPFEEAGKLTEAESVIKESVRIREEPSRHPDDADYGVARHLRRTESDSRKHPILILGAVKQGNAEGHE